MCACVMQACLCTCTCECKEYVSVHMSTCILLYKGTKYNLWNSSMYNFIRVATITRQLP